MAYPNLAIFFESSRQYRGRVQDTRWFEKWPWTVKTVQGGETTAGETCECSQISPEECTWGFTWRLGRGVKHHADRLFKGRCRTRQTA